MKGIIFAAALPFVFYGLLTAAANGYNVSLSPAFADTVTVKTIEDDMRIIQAAGDLVEVARRVTERCDSLEADLSALAARVEKLEHPPTISDGGRVVPSDLFHGDRMPTYPGQWQNLTASVPLFMPMPHGTIEAVPNSDFTLWDPTRTITTPLRGNQLERFMPGDSTGAVLILNMVDSSPVELVRIHGADASTTLGELERIPCPDGRPCCAVAHYRKRGTK